jgi:hypothetical protein
MNVERVSDCCLSQCEQFFSHIMAKTTYFRLDGDDDVRFVLYERALLAYAFL